MNLYMCMYGVCVYAYVLRHTASLERGRFVCLDVYVCVCVCVYV